MTKSSTIIVFANTVKKFIASLGTLGLAEPEECHSIYAEDPKELFARFMQARITRIRAVENEKVYDKKKQK